MSELRVTVLIENTAPAGLVREHGLSLWLEYRGRRVLLDAGESGAFLVNAERLGIDLAQAEAAVLSHGHYDHGDGFSAFFAVNRAARVYARPLAAERSFHGERDIGVKPGLFQRRGGRFDFADGPRELFPGLHLIPDSVPHEQSLAAETEQGLVVFNSCCHAGAGYIVREIKERFPGVPVRALIGGLHLMGNDGPKSLGAAPGIVKNLGNWLLDELQVQELYTGHCTGAPAFELLKEGHPDRVRPLTTGLVMEF